MSHPDAVMDRHPVFEVVFFFLFFLVHGPGELAWRILGEQLGPRVV